MTIILSNMVSDVKVNFVTRADRIDYFRTTPYFETSSEKYGWMNRICSIATGSRKGSGRTFEVFQVL